PVEGFDAAARRGEIAALLQGWGCDLDLFAPEIDAALARPIGLAELRQWQDETARQRPLRPPAEPGAGSRRSRRREAIGVGGREPDRRIRKQLLGLLETLQEGDKIGLKAGRRVTLDSGKIPVEPSGVLGGRARLAAARLGQFEVELGSEGYKLHL